MSSKTERYIVGAMQAICELMQYYGVSKETAYALARASVDRGYAVSIGKDRDTRRISRAADICARWHIEKEFVDAKGRPRPLSWNGKTGTLLTLARRVVGPKDSREVIEDLVSRRLIRRNRTGAWLPRSKIVPPVASSAAQVLRSASMVERLLRTIIYNSDRRYRGDVLLEVMAQVPRLPVGSLQAFRRFAKSQGVSFIKTIDDWLETRNLPRRKRSQTPWQEAGVVAFAFVQPNAIERGAPSRRG